MAQQDTAEVKALTFDVFGTVVDWRGSLIREGLAFGAARGIQIDWASFADDWRGGYSPSMNRVRHGELPWTNIDALHRMAGCRAWPHPSPRPLCAGDALERQCRLAHQYGKICRPAVGLYSLSRVD